MKSVLSAILFLAVVRLSLSAASPAVRVDIQAEKGELAPAGKNIRFAEWLGAKRKTRLVFVESFEKEEWKRCSFSFLPEKDGFVTLILRGPDAKKEHLWVLYRNLRWNGKALEKGELPDGWRIRKTASGRNAAVVEDPALTPEGPCVRVWHDGFISRRIPVKGGRKVTVEVDACPTDAFTPLSGMYPLALAPFANRDYADEIEQDGKGGWSDQGPDKDLRKFDLSRSMFGGIRFQLVRPSANRGNGVAVFDSSRSPTGLREIEFNVPEEARNSRFLYLLHTGCYVPGKAEPVGTVVFEDRNGKRAEHLLVSGTDLLDWNRSGSAENALSVSSGHYSGDPRSVYLSRIPVPLAEMKKIRLRSAGKMIWILCAATLSDREIQWKETFFPPAPPDWQPADLAPTPFTLAGSALDLSSLPYGIPDSPRVRVVPAGSGDMVQENRPAPPLRFRQAYFFGADWSFMRSLRKLSAAELKRMIDDYVAELRRRGYNMVRTHTIEQFLMLDAPGNGTPDPRFADAVDYCFAQLAKNGIRLNLNIAAYQFLYPFTLSSSSRPQDIKPKFIFGDPKTRQDWLECARYFLCRINPYTGRALKDEPMLVFVEPFNELGQAMRRTPYKEESTRKFVREKFRAYVLQRNGRVEESRFPHNPNEVEGGAMRQEWLEFCVRSLRESGAWMNRQLRDLGCRAPIGQYNISPARYFGDIRYEQSDFVLRNSYFCHPSNLTRNGSVTRQQSAVETVLPYFTNVASCRFADRPMVVSEYNHARNRYEYEQLLFPAYAAFQGFAGITLHSVNLNPSWGREGVFSTYIDRMSEYLSYFLFQRGDVTPSQHLVELRIPKSSLFARGADSAIAPEQARWALLTRFAVRYEETSRPPMVARHPFPKAAAAMPLTGYAAVTGATMFTETGTSGGKRFDPLPLIASLRKKGVFSAENRSDPSAGIWESDTGELLLLARRKTFLLRTPRTEAAVFEKNPDISLPVLSKIWSSVPSAVALVSRGGKALKEESHLLLFYLTGSFNSRMKLSADGSLLLGNGTLPTLLRTGRLELHLKLFPGRWTLYPLRSDGLRRKGIPLERTPDGFRLHLDTAALPDGPTGVFELVSDGR